MEVDLVLDFMTACEYGNLGRVHELLDKDSVTVDSSDDEENTALHLAAANGHEAVVALLLKRGALVDKTNAYGWTPLMQAARQGHTAVVVLLVENHACVNASNKLGITGLVCAARSGHLSTVRVLLENGTDVKDFPEAELTPLMVAAQFGYDSIVRLLIESGCDVNYSTQSSGLSALMVAATNGHRTIAKILVEHNVNVHATNVSCKTALDMAIQKGRRQIRCYLDQAMTNQKASDAASKHNIFEATKLGDIEMVSQLLADHPQQISEIRKEDGTTPLMLAAKIGDIAMVKFLIEKGAKVDQQDQKSGMTPLTQAVFHGNSDVAHYLINYGADVNVQTRNGCTAFDIASMSDKTDRNLLRILTQLTSYTSIHSSYSFMTLTPGENYRIGNKNLWTRLSSPFRIHKSNKGRNQYGSLHPLNQTRRSCPVLTPVLKHQAFLSPPPIIRVAHSSSPESDEIKSPLLIHGSASPCRLATPSNTLKPVVSPMLPSSGLDTSNAGRSFMPPGKKLEPPNILSKTKTPSKQKDVHLRKKFCPAVNLWKQNRCFQEFSKALPTKDTSDQDGLYDILKKWSLERYYPVFEEQEVDREALALLTESDFKELGINTTVSRERLSKAIQQLKASQLSH